MKKQTAVVKAEPSKKENAKLIGIFVFLILSATLMGTLDGFNVLEWIRWFMGGFMIIFGKDERVKFEEIRETLSDPVCRQYDEATTYRDGKWVMFEPTDTYEFDDYMKLLAIKRKPNRK